MPEIHFDDFSPTLLSVFISETQKTKNLNWAKKLLDWQPKNYKLLFQNIIEESEETDQIPYYVYWAYTYKLVDKKWMQSIFDKHPDLSTVSTGGYLLRLAQQQKNLIPWVKSLLIKHHNENVALELSLSVKGVSSRWYFNNFVKKDSK